MAPRMAPQGLPPLARYARAKMGQRHLPADRLPGRLLLLRAQDHGGARETIVEGETGWLFPPGDIDALTAALDKVLDLDQETRARLARKAIANVRENFSQQAMCRKTLDVYEEVLQSKAG